MRMLLGESVLFRRRVPARALALEARAAGISRVLFVHGARSHVLGTASSTMVAELHRVADAHVVVCQDRPLEHRRAGTMRIRVWASRDEGDTWAPDRSFDVTSISARTRLARAEGEE